MWRSTGAFALRAPDKERTARTIVVRGALINLLNPKLTLFFFAFLPQFISEGSSATAQMVWLGAVFMLVTLAVFVMYGALASQVRRHVVGSPTVVRRLQRGFAGVFAVLGARLALQDH
jgi:threonine/homoserine/homoserine lactone efflux protein